MTVAINKDLEAFDGAFVDIFQGSLDALASKIKNNPKIIEMFYKNGEVSRGIGCTSIEAKCGNLLHQAVRCRDLKKDKSLVRIIDLLIQKKVDVNLQTHDGWTPLLIASRNNDFAVMEKLIQSNANVNIQNQTNKLFALLFAARFNNMRGIELLVQSKADVNLRDNFNFTALYWTTFNSNDRAVSLLINSKASFSEDYDRCLRLAQEKNNKELEQLVKSSK